MILKIIFFAIPVYRHPYLAELLLVLGHLLQHLREVPHRGLLGKNMRTVVTANASMTHTNTTSQQFENVSLETIRSLLW